MRSQEYLSSHLRLIRLREVLMLTGLSESALRRAMARGEFPRSVKLLALGRSCAWDHAAVTRWVESRLEGAAGSDRKGAT
jgi:prophage regulatory protein